MWLWLLGLLAILFSYPRNYLHLNKLKIFHLLNQKFGQYLILQKFSVILYEIFMFQYFPIFLLIFILISYIKRPENENFYDKVDEIVFLEQKGAINKSNDSIVNISLGFSKVFYVILLFIIFGGIFTFLKFYVDEPRPYCVTNNYYSIFNFNKVRDLSSYPSAHTGMAVIYVWILYKFWFRNVSNKYSYIIHVILQAIYWIFASILICIVGLSRIILAMHYVSDLIGGIIFSFIAIGATEFIAKRQIYKKLLQIIYKYFKS